MTSNTTSGQTEFLPKEVLTVSQFNSLIKEVLATLGKFRIQGEITEFTITQNQGVNITLSDGKANLRVGGYAPTISGVDLIDKDMKVIVEGVADLYILRGSFSLRAYSIEPVGEGSLAIVYQKLKQKLEEQGLFAPEHKQELPLFITKIALLTGKDSAAYSDFIKILKEHKTSIEILYYPVLVQGPKSVTSIKKALLEARDSDVDIIVLTRGGGSLEDLKGFNDEGLAQIIFSSPIPVIAGVGHEKDESIADFVADIRTSTPSQAAYYIANRNQEFLDTVTLTGEKIEETLKNILSEQSQALQSLTKQIRYSIESMLKNFKEKITAIERILKSFKIQTVLKRGFAIIQKKGRDIKSIKEIQLKDVINTLLVDGKFFSRVNKISK